MKPEQKVWKYQLKPALDRIPGLVYERVELKTGRKGMPDVVYTLRKTGWIENKFSYKPGRIDLRHWTLEQRRWAKRHIKAGARVFLFVGYFQGDAKYCSILDPREAMEHVVLKPDHPACIATWQGKASHTELRDILNGNIYLSREVN